jgi:Zn-dependent peptidase ImmA (M78 family)
VGSIDSQGITPVEKPADIFVMIGQFDQHGKTCPNRQRFTIAHELGHLLLHKDEVHIDRAFRNSISSQAIDANEIEANRFAAELLMPFHLLKNEDISNIDVEDESSLRDLARKFKVSLQAMTLRVTNIFDI